MAGAPARTRAHPSVLVVALIVLVLALSGAILPHAAQANNPAAAAALAHVRYIQRGLTVQPPHATAGKGKVKQSLFTQYGLQTRQKQKASIDFQDGSLLNMNQLTTAVLHSAAVTQLKRGEVEEQVVPGTNHQVQTAAAVASAVGTIFDVRVQGNITIITVIEGAVLVQTPQGNILVRSGEQVRITKGQAPSQPASTNTTAAMGWTASIPPPSAPLGTNIALAANGGQIYRWTSQRDDPNHTFDAANANDGSTQRGWQSAAGQTSEQSLWVRFQGLSPYTITGIMLDCAATGGEDPADAAQDFTILASNDSSGAGSGFTPVVSGICGEQNNIQVFPLSVKQRAADVRTEALATVQATALQFEFKDNHGGKDGIAVAEVGVIGEEQPAVLGTPTPEPTATNTPIPTNTPTPAATPTATIPAVVSLTAPGSIDFGSVLYGQTSPGVGISIANNGTVATTIQHLDLQGGGQGAFTIVDDTCTGKTLQPGAQCTVAVSFQPVAAAGNTGSVLVTYSGSSTPLSISLGGHGYYLQLSIPTIQATWDDPGTTTQRMVTLSNGTACATATHFSSAFLIDSGAAMNAVSTIANAPLSQPRLVHTIRYTNNGALVWQAQLFVQIVGVGTGSVQVQVTAQTMGQGSAFQILTPMVTPVVSQVDQCPAGLAPPDISP